ncbi:MAG TPA: Gfo/Idh/MocA family oxidoreductase [Acidimicrobiales bacterium]|nr:Gfo/Idh/MocA family oxidoreductase [Acidimicrobiales bacterium]
MAAVCTTNKATAEASANAFGASLAFDDFDAMVSHQDVDMVVVCVRAPYHRELTMRAVRAGKPVFCEWPLGANLAEAKEMAAGVRTAGLRSIVGLQARSDPVVMYAREMLQQGFVGDVLTVKLSVIDQAITKRGPGRIWQRVRSNGANTLTIAAGHAIDSLCAIVGEVSSVSARVTTRITEWLTETGEPMPVDAPDTIGAVGSLVNGTEIAFHCATVPFNPSGNVMEIYGSEGTLVISTTRHGRTMRGAQRGDTLDEMAIPDRFTLVPKDTPVGPPFNVAQAYARFAEATKTGEPFDPDFDRAVKRHQLIDAIERSHEERRTVALAE